jgi:hypothetical protein
MTINEILQIIFSAVVALSTVAYSILTWRLVAETRRMREFQITPDINIFFERSEADPSFTFIVFKNSGLGYAKNVKIKIIKDFEHYDNINQELKSKGIIKNGIESFYSNQSYKFYFTDVSQNHHQKMSDNLLLKTTYYDLNNKMFTKEINLSLFELTGMSVLTPPDSYLGMISYELSEIKKLIKEEFQKK